MSPRLHKRRGSKDLPLDFSDLVKTLPKYAASYIKLFDRKKPQMRRIVYGLHKVAAEVKHMRETSRKARRAALRYVAAGFVAAASAALFTGTFSFTVLTVAAVCAATGAAAVTFTKKQFARHKDSGKKVKEFLRIVKLLRSELEEIKKVCEDLHRESAEAGNIARLKRDINQLLDVTRKLQTFTSSDCITEVSAQCEEAVKEFEKMKKQLKELRESRH